MVTEMDKLERAREYLEKLAEGTDPLTGQELPQDTVLNNLRLSRCFFYVAGVLGKVIANGGNIGRAAGGQIPFYITEAELAKVSISDTLVPVSIFVKAANEAVSLPARKKLSVLSVTNWLMKEGYLKTVEAEGSHKRTLTDKSESIGMSCELREGARGTYEIMLYDTQAQRFLLDNIKHIING